MRSFSVLSASLIAVGALWATTPTKAQDASWGCQVLLCAASQNPSWHGVSYCVPPMTRLIAAMSKPGFDWPICHEAKAGKPGREEYENCPAGTHIGYTESGRDGQNREPNLCIKTINRCSDRGVKFGSYYGSGRDRESCVQTVSSPRPRRADPWFFDIPNDQGQKQRFWFNLRT